MIGTSMLWDEAVNLIRILRADPASMLAAAIEGWDYPVTREAVVLMDLWDLEYAKAGVKRPERYTRPWKILDGRRHGKARPYSETVAILNRFGHSLPEAPV